MKSLDRLKEISDKLEHAEEMFQSLFEAVPDSLIIVNSYGRIERVNTTTETTFGYSRKELIGQPVEILAPKDDQQSFIEARSRPTGKSVGLVAQRKNGSTFKVDVMLGHLVTNNGSLSVCVVRDVTHREVVNGGK